jgi:TPR repeat protein
METEELLEQANEYYKNKDYEHALELYKQCDAYSIVALYNLGTIYEEGLGTSRDIDKAIAYYGECADSYEDLENEIGELEGLKGFETYRIDSEDEQAYCDALARLGALEGEVDF